MTSVTGPTTNGRSPSRPPTTYFSVGQRLFRGYGPAAVLAGLLIVTALAVPSRVPKTGNVSSGSGAGLGSNGSGTGQAGGNLSASGASSGAPASAGPGSQGATASAGSSSGGQSGTAGSPGSSGRAGHTVTVSGQTAPCAGQALQVPGDPYSPPCIAFSGNNGGATSKGVTGNSIVLSVRLTSDQSFQQTLAQLAGAQLQDTNADNVRTIEALAQYFNTHFQFYGRKLVIKTFNGQGSLSNELQGNGQPQAEADATTAGDQIGAFADITAESEPYATALWQKGVMGFGDPYMPGYWHTNHAPYDWSTATDGTDLATAIGKYAVQKLCGGNADYAGGGLKGQPRKFAGIAPANELYQVSATVFKQVMNAAGCQVDNYGYTLDLGTESQQAENLVAQLKAKGYTTIICGCDPIFPVYLTGQEAQQNYIPEFVEIGAALVDQDYVGQLYNQQAFAHTIGISPNEPAVPYTQTIGYEAYKTVSASSEPAFFVNNIYLQMDMLAIGIEMAGPDLTPGSFQAGMFKYPPRLGPAGLWGFSPNQYTVPNDFREVCWDPNVASPYNGKQGAYVEGTNKGQRWTENSVPKGAPGCPVPTS
jgi:hypothetical protein